ncbi:hypothetical protein IL306_000347 [Fusarium sp. DS 682]|nr:hypothetical protein IL306_000347 [Fusarium sp. DS 682]
MSNFRGENTVSGLASSISNMRLENAQFEEDISQTYSRREKVEKANRWFEGYIGQRIDLLILLHDELSEVQKLHKSVFPGELISDVAKDLEIRFCELCATAISERWYHHFMEIYQMKEKLRYRLDKSLVSLSPELRAAGVSSKELKRKRSGMN